DQGNVLIDLCHTSNPDPGVVGLTWLERGRWCAVATQATPARFPHLRRLAGFFRPAPQYPTRTQPAPAIEPGDDCGIIDLTIFAQGVHPTRAQQVEPHAAGTMTRGIIKPRHQQDFTRLAYCDRQLITTDTGPLAHG